MAKHYYRKSERSPERAAKLRASAIASRGSRGPLGAVHRPLAGLFNNVSSPGLNQTNVAPPDSTGAIGPNNYIEMVNQQIEDAIKTRGRGKLEDLFANDDTWVVE